MDIFKYEKGFWPNTIAISYILFGYGFGVVAIIAESITLNLIGTLLLAHSMVIAAYLLHECAHNSLFKNKKYHYYLGNLLMWITGSSYGNYYDIQHKHFRHHADKADVVAFDYRKRLANYPLLVKFLAMLEWLYIPAVEIMMHILVIILPFTVETRKHRRGKVIFMLLLRLPLFIYLSMLSLSFAVLYPLAYMMFLTVMRFMDTHQHTYEIYETLERERGEEAKKFSREYEQRNTFSNLVSSRYPFLNLLVLNFGYHNAHHTKAGVPWYKLPELHQSLFDKDDSQVFPFWNLLKSFHKYRVARILNEDIGDIGMNEKKGTDFIGVDGVSFLTAH